MKKDVKKTMVLGVFLFTMGVIAYTILFFGHETTSVFPLLQLLLLLITLLGYVGVLTFAIGIVVFSLHRSKKFKIITWTILALILLIFIPFPQECTFQSDIGYCEPVFPYQPQYWKHAYSAVTLQEETRVSNEVYWQSFGAFLIVEEGIGDTLDAIKVTSKGIF